MTYEAEITWYDTRPDGDDITREQTCSTIQDAVDFLQRMAVARPACRAWINNRQVQMRNGRAVDDAGGPICTNEKWHEIFATPTQKISPLSSTDLLRRVQGQMDRVFRPASACPTYPATLLASGKLE